MAKQSEHPRSAPKSDAKLESAEAESAYTHWTIEHLRAETEARRISVREDAEPVEYRAALVADDDAKAEAQRAADAQARANPGTVPSQ